MNRRQIPGNGSSTKVLNLILQPTLAWVAILGLVFFSTVFILAGAGKILNLAFPAAALAVGVLLYIRYPILYIGFTWWMWFLTPFVRRLIDYRSTFTDPSPVLLSPYLVTLVTLATLWQHLPKTHRQGGLPFVLAFVGVFYGYFIGIIQNSFVVSSKALLEWLSPVLFGFHLFVNWQNYPDYRQNIQRVFFWCVLVTGIYGVVQYLVAPEWDRFWLINLKEKAVTFGRPEPFQIRVWSTMSGPLVFAVTMMAGLLLLFNSKEALRLPAIVTGYLAFLLSLVRTAWIGWGIGMVTLAASLKANLQMRLIVTLIVLAVCVTPLTTMEPFSKAINSRLQTLSNVSDVENDGSGRERALTYKKNLNDALNSYVGRGIGGMAGTDSAFLDMLFALGWLGTIFYLGGMLLLILKLFQSPESSIDTFASTARAITVGIFFELGLGPVMVGLSGVVFWGFLGMAMAACNYYQYQRTAKLKQSLQHNQK